MGRDNQVLFSFVIGAYNVGQYLEECIDSIEMQTVDKKQYEVIVVDDESNDGTEALCNKLIGKYTNFRYFRIPHSGVSVARNMGIRESVGEYLLFVDGDDKVCSNYVESLYSNMDADIDIVCCDYISFSGGEYCECAFFEDASTMMSNSEKQKLFLQLIDPKYGKPKGCSPTAVGVPWGKMYRKKLICDANLSFDDKLLRMQDNDFNLRVFYFARKIRYIHKYLYYYRVNHIRTQNAGAYGLNVWSELYSRREAFFLEHAELLSRELVALKNSKMFQTISYCITYFVVKLPREEALARIRLLKNTEPFLTLISRNNEIPQKYRIIQKLLAYDKYTIIYKFYSIYHHKKGTSFES